MDNMNIINVKGKIALSNSGTCMMFFWRKYQMGLSVLR